MSTPIELESINSVRQPWGEETVLLAFVAIVLLLLSLVPVGFEQVIRPHREYIEEVIQPARESARNIESRSSEEVALSRGYLLTRDAELHRQYRHVQQDQQRSVERLRAQVARLQEPELRNLVGSLEALLARRHEPVVEPRPGGFTAEEYVSRITERQALLTEIATTVQRIAD